MPTSSSALSQIDINNIITDLNGKMDRDMKNSDIAKDYFFDGNFIIIYPNGGSKESPANIELNSFYVERNPFPGYQVYCLPEIYYQNEWISILMPAGNQGSGSCAWGILATNDNNNFNNINIRRLNTGFAVFGVYALQDAPDIRTACPCRIKVWKVGKLSN